MPLPVRPRRMAHVLLFARDVSRTLAFYTRVLGLRLSDEAGGVIAFLHGVHGSDHHMVAFAKSDGPGFHHCSWDVGSVNDIGVGAAHMADKGFSAGWGLGRHVLGSNYFHYVRDPWGSYCRVFLRHRLRFGGHGLARRVARRREQPLSLGAGAAARFHVQLRSLAGSAAHRAPAISHRPARRPRAATRNDVNRRNVRAG